MGGAAAHFFIERTARSHRSFFAATRPGNRSIAQSLNRHFSLHFFSPRAGTTLRENFLQRRRGGSEKIFYFS
jgi:hypothetical protein